MASKLSSISQCHGVVRSLSTAFFTYKKAERGEKTSGQAFSISPESGRVLLLTGVPLSDIGTEAKEKDLPPIWADTYDKAGLMLSQIEKKLEQLKAAQQQRIQTAFGDVKSKDREIALITSQITTHMRECEGFIKSIGAVSGEDMVRGNIQKQLAGRLQDLAQKQRLLQRGYMEKLKKVFAGDEVQEAEFDLDQSEEVLDDLSELDLQRNEQLDTLINNLNELAFIFKDLASLVVEQGTLLDRIDYNLQEAVHHTSTGVAELVKAEKRQRTMRATACILVLIMLIVVLVLALVLKHV